jgi:Cdc6-like AAA superfamily ATPase
LIVNINKLKLTDSPYTTDRKKSFLLEANEVIDQIGLELQYGTPSSFLISGYRGVGKTSFVNRVAEKLGNDAICVNINLAKYEGYSAIIKKLIRALYLKYDIYNADKEQTTDILKLNKEFELLYDRTFHDIVNSHIVNSKKENKTSSEIDLDLKKTIPIFLSLISATNLAFDFLNSKAIGYIFFIISLAWACVSSFKLNFTKTTTGSDAEELSRKSLYDDGIAEHHLLSILKNLQANNINVLISFDEIDKIQSKEEVDKLINDLKFLLLSGSANFFIIAGQTLYYEFEKSVFRDDQVISTLFSKSVHVPFLKYATLKKYCIDLIEDDTVKSNPLVSDFFDSLILTSGRIPRKLVNLIRAKLLWKNEQAFIAIDEEDGQHLKNETELLHSLTKIMDNELPGIASNAVQLDFFIAQIHLWIAKMKLYTSVNFFMSEIIDIKSYENLYPGTYVAQLDALGELLTDELTQQKILKVKHYDEEQAESSYSWNYKVSALPADDGRPNNNNPDDDGPTDDTPPSVDPKFVMDFAELEAFVREIYLELTPEDTKKGKYSFAELINRLIEIGVLTKSWYSSRKVQELVKTKNKVVHGEAIGPEDLNVIQSSAFTLSRLKSEVVEDFIFYITERYLQSFNVTKGKNEFDFTAIKDNDVILFEVKSIQSGKPDPRNIQEIFDKFNNYAIGSSQNIYYVQFFFRQNRRKSFDDFYIKFNETMNAEYPDRKDKFSLFYISEADGNSIKKKIEIYLGEVINKFNFNKN